MPKNLAPKSRIPPNAERVFTGVIFDAFHWSQKMYDGSTATFEMLKRADTLVVIATTPKQKIVLLQEAQPTKPAGPSLPGGRREGNEDALTGAQRELLEETGYTAKTFKLWYTEHPYNKIDWNIFVFIARGAVKTSKPTLDAGEKISVKEISFDQFLKLADDPHFHEPSLKLKLLKARYDKTERAKLQKILFG